MREISNDSIELVLHKVHSKVCSFWDVANRPMRSDVLMDFKALGKSVRILVSKASSLKKSEVNTSFYQREVINTIKYLVHDNTLHHEHSYYPVDSVSLDPLNSGHCPIKCILDTSKKSIRYCRALINDLTNHLPESEVQEHKQSNLVGFYFISNTKTFSPSMWNKLPIGNPLNSGASISYPSGYIFTPMPMYTYKLDDVPYMSSLLKVCFILLAHRMLEKAKQGAYYLDHYSVGESAWEVIDMVKDVGNYGTIKSVLGKEYHSIFDSISSEYLSEDLRVEVYRLIGAVSNTLLRHLSISDLPAELMSSIAGQGIRPDILVSTVIPNSSSRSHIKNKFSSIVLPTNTSLLQVLDGDFSIGMDVLHTGQLDRLIADSYMKVEVGVLHDVPKLSTIPGVRQVVDSITSEAESLSMSNSTLSDIPRSLRIPREPRSVLYDLSNKYCYPRIREGVNKIANNISRLTLLNTRSGSC